VRRNGTYHFEEGLPQIVQRKRLIEKENRKELPFAAAFAQLNHLCNSQKKNPAAMRDL